MRKILTSVAVAMALSFAAANAPAKAQGSAAPFDSAYSQPANMIDGLDIGTPVALHETEVESGMMAYFLQPLSGPVNQPTHAYVGGLVSSPGGRDEGRAPRVGGRF
jgi:hypothetical protein